MFLNRILRKLETEFEKFKDGKEFSCDDLCNTLVPAVPHRIALASPAGILNPSDVLLGWYLEGFESIEARVVAQLRCDPSMPQPCHRVAFEDEPIIREMLIDSKIVIPIRAS